MLTWDETKRKLNIKGHGLDFAGCDAIWDHFTVTREDIRRDYGEARLVCFGLSACRPEKWLSLFTRNARAGRT